MAWNLDAATIRGPTSARSSTRPLRRVGSGLRAGLGNYDHWEHHARRRGRCSTRPAAGAGDVAHDRTCRAAADRPARVRLHLRARRLPPVMPYDGVCLFGRQLLRLPAHVVAGNLGKWLVAVLERWWRYGTPTELRTQQVVAQLGKQRRDDGRATVHLASGDQWQHHPTGYIDREHVGPDPLTPCGRRQGG